MQIRCRKGSAVQQALRELVQGGAAIEDEVVAVLDLRKEQPVLTARLVALLGVEERSERGQPFLTAAQQILGAKRVGKLLQSSGISTPQESVGGRLKVNPLFPQAKGQPVVLVQAYPRGEGKVGRQAHKHPAPALVVELEVVLVGPTLLEFLVRAVVLLSPDGQQDAGRLPRLEDDGNSIAWAVPKILLNKIISPLFLGRFHDGSAGAPHFSDRFFTQYWN
jgi:hypothetical protein